MDQLKENECKFCHKKTKNGIRKHISKRKICQNHYSEADLRTLKKWAKDKKNTKREAKRKKDRNALLKLDKVKMDVLKENECKFCHKKTKSGIRKHISQSEICQNAYSEADMRMLKQWAEDRKNAKRDEKRQNDSDYRLKLAEKNKKFYNSKKRAEYHKKVYDPEWRAELHRRNYDYNKRSELHDKTYDPKKRSKLYDKFYEKKEAEKERITKELNEKYQKTPEQIDKQYEDKARKENSFNWKISKEYFERASHDIDKMANLSKEIRDQIKKIGTKIEENYKSYEAKIDNAVEKTALGNKLVQDIYSEELFGEKCHYNIFDVWHDLKLQMDLEFINMAKILKKVYPGVFVCTCFQCQDAKGAKTIMQSSENQGLSTHTLGKKHMRCTYILSKQRYEQKAKTRGEKIM